MKQRKSGRKSSTKRPPIAAPHLARLATKRGVHDLTRDDLGYGGFVGLGEHERTQLDEIRRRGYLNADAPVLTQHSDQPMQIPEAEPLSDAEIRIRVARNMKKFMLACGGWSFDVLASRTERPNEINRKTVWAHLNGKMTARPGTQWVYVQIFAKELNLSLPPDSLVKE